MNLIARKRGADLAPVIPPKVHPSTAENLVGHDLAPIRIMQRRHLGWNEGWAQTFSQLVS